MAIGLSSQPRPWKAMNNLKRNGSFKQILHGHLAVYDAAVLAIGNAKGCNYFVSSPKKVGAFYQKSAIFP